MGVNAPLNRKLRMGLIGGGQGSFIGRVHSIAAIMDHRAALVAGALSADPVKARESAGDYDIRPERAYGSYKEMVEAKRNCPPTSASTSPPSPRRTTPISRSPRPSPRPAST